MTYVRWDLAKTADNSIYWISDNCDVQLYCLECNGEMIPVKGAVKQHHFRHSVEGNCSGESALHLSKKYEIHEYASKVGESEVEKAVGGYIADVCFEKEWAFEVVVTNPPSEMKMKELGEKLVIFNFSDTGRWYGSYLYGETLEEVVAQITTHIKENTTDSREFSVCPICREVGGMYARIKCEGICPSCDQDRAFKVNETRERNKAVRERNKVVGELNQRRLQEKKRLEPHRERARNHMNRVHEEERRKNNDC